MIAEKTSMTLSMNHQKLNNKIIEMERNMQTWKIPASWMHRNCRRSKNSITNDLLKEHIILIFEKLEVVIEAMDLVSLS